jgi:hypothetical protein
MGLPPTPVDDDDLVARSEREQRQQRLKEQAEDYGQRLAERRAKGDSLMAKKLDLERQLQNLSADVTSAPSADNRQLLDLLTAQQEKNQLALLQLQQQLQAVSQTSPLEIKSDDLLLKEINKMRQRYLQNGGSNPEILIEFAQMEQEAIALAAKHGEAAIKKWKGIDEHRSVNEQLLELELENQRLQDELANLHEANTEALQRGILSADEHPGRKHSSRQEHHLSELLALERDVELASQRARLAMLKRKLDEIEQNVAMIGEAPGRVSSIPSVPSVKDGADAVEPVLQYNPSTGFVVFYDFIAGFEPPSGYTVQLLATTYNGVSVFRPPTVHPATFTATGFLPDPQLGAISIIGGKDSVRNCPASNDTVLILELQTTSVGVGWLQTTRAWCRVELFNKAGQILANWWRIPFRSPPIDLLESSRAVASSRKYGNTEMFLRIVNQPNADAQSLVKVLPSEHARYQYA